MSRSEPRRLYVQSGTAPAGGRSYSDDMPLLAAARVADPEAELRWRNWQARGLEDDRRTAKKMRGVMVVMVAALLAWFAAQFV